MPPALAAVPGVCRATRFNPPPPPAPSLVSYTQTHIRTHTFKRRKTTTTTKLWRAGIHRVCLSLKRDAHSQSFAQFRRASFLPPRKRLDTVVPAALN